MNGYPLLKGYQVLRMDSLLNILKTSALITGIEYADSLGTGVPGTKLYYGVRACNTADICGLNGGDINARPVVFLVP